MKVKNLSQKSFYVKGISRLHSGITDLREKRASIQTFEKTVFYRII